MHMTTVVTKKGEIFKGCIWTFRPEKNMFIITGDELHVFSFDEVKSVITEADRISATEIGDVDEIKFAASILKEGRRRGWFNPPVFEWEKNEERTP